MTTNDIQHNLNCECRNWIERQAAEEARKRMAQLDRDERNTLALIVVSAIAAVVVMLIAVGMSTGVL